MVHQVDYNDRRISYTAVAGQTVFDYDFPINDVNDLAVYHNDLLLEKAAYNIDLDVKTVTLTNNTEKGDSIVIEGQITPIRDVIYPRRGGLDTNVLNGEFNKIYYMMQEMVRDSVRSIHLAKSDSSVSVSVTLPPRQEGKALLWGQTGLKNSMTNIDNLDEELALASNLVLAADLAKTEAENARDIALDARDDAVAAAAIMPQNNYAATVDPTADDDSTKGYSVGSKWVNVADYEAFICLDSTASAAVWEWTSLDIDDLGILAIKDNIGFDDLAQNLKGGIADIESGNEEKLALTSAVKDYAAVVKRIPQNVKNVNYTLQAGDSGGHIFCGSGANTYTIPANAAISFAVGTAISFVNYSTVALNIVITNDTLRLAGAGSTGPRALAQYGTATALKIKATEWLISGVGLS